MATCEECVHVEVCKDFISSLLEGLELPCRVGDTVYRLIHGTINEYKVVSINYHVCSTFTDYTITSKHLSAPVNFNFDVNAIGKIVFLSREEAEQALNGACRKCLK